MMSFRTVVACLYLFVTVVVAVAVDNWTKSFTVIGTFILCKLHVHTHLESRVSLTLTFLTKMNMLICIRKHNKIRVIVLLLLIDMIIIK